MCSRCGQCQNQCCCPCFNRFDQVRRLFTGCELLRVTEFTNEFFNRFGRLPTCDERRCIEESCRGISDINLMELPSKNKTY